MTLAVEFAVDEPGSCPVAAASEAAGSPVDSVARASLAGAGTVTEEFTAPADAGVAEATSTDVEAVGAVGGGNHGAAAVGGESAGPNDGESVGSSGAEAVYRFERDPSSACVCESIEELAGPATDVRAEDGGLVVTTRVDDLETVRSVVERLRERFDGVSVRSLRNLAETGGDGVLAADAPLTERQREVVETAYEMGYYEYPKGANAGEVADALDISRSTLAEHLAAAQGKLLASALE